jgi:hypothetical protein
MEGCDQMIPTEKDEQKTTEILLKIIDEDGNLTCRISECREIIAQALADERERALEIAARRMRIAGYISYDLSAKEILALKDKHD